MTTNLLSLGRSVQSVRLRISIEGFLTVSFQMRRVDMPFMFDLLETDIPLRITYTGHVSFVDAAGNEFSISLSQNMGMLTIHVLMFENEAVPALNQIVSCSGNLLMVEEVEPVILLEGNVVQL